MLVLVYDVLLYLWRWTTYNLPFIGGRARGRQRPQAPSLTERPSGNKRRFSLAGMPRPQSAQDDATVSTNSEAESDGAVTRPVLDAANDKW